MICLPKAMYDLWNRKFSFLNKYSAMMNILDYCTTNLNLPLFQQIACKSLSTEIHGTEKRMKNMENLTKTIIIT